MTNIKLERVFQYIKLNKTSIYTENKHRVSNCSNQVYLAAVILVRLYKEDKAKLTRLELKQWIEYMLYAGVRCIYLYDHFMFKNESLQQWCNEKFPNIVVYHEWKAQIPYSITRTQVTAYKHALLSYGNISEWQIAFDMDEYPFMPGDKRREFLIRFLMKIATMHPIISELSLKNFLFLGKPRKETHILKRYLRRTPNPANALDKPIYRTKNIQSVHIHHNTLRKGISRDANPKEIRMNHYWGARLQNWGEDTPDILKKTIFDDSIVEIAEQLK
ncbi:unnamed protein product [Mytilus coruscus]|uniref:Glycosyltransferase family 92 protein n=1 Tax=Mytilus coruscus TaxID=42192 RepID=A0A6J8EAC1_MYTCO|nr:unnamed protein product [Mytilus coruscus]